MNPAVADSSTDILKQDLEDAQEKCKDMVEDLYRARDELHKSEQQKEKVGICLVLLWKLIKEFVNPPYILSSYFSDPVLYPFSNKNLNPGRCLLLVWRYFVSELL